MRTLKHKRAKVNGVTLHYVVAGSGPVVLCMHGWPQNHREVLPMIGYADSDKPVDGYEPLTIAADMVALLDDHCFAIAVSAEGGVIEECGHWVSDEQPDFIRKELARFWAIQG